MFRLRLLLAALCLSAFVGCNSCCGHPWFNWFNRSCCQPCCEPCCNGCGSSGYETTVISSAPVAVPAVNAAPAPVVPAPSGAVVVPQQPQFAKPVPYVPNGK
jgi:hypothetical protein